MSAALKQTTPTTETHEGTLLDQILERVDAIAIQQSRPSPVRLQTWEEIERFAEKAARSGMVPKDYVSKPDAIVIAVMMGSELGLAPMQALQNIAVINGRPSIWGDAMPGLIRASGKCQYIKEWSTGEGDSLTFFCEAKRKDDPTPSIGRFGVAEAKKAGLWNKDLYAKYPQRMLLARARGFGLRDGFPDVLKGLISAEEARDMVPFEATGLTPRQEPLTTGQIIGDSVPHMDAPAPKKRTWSDFLDELEPRLEAAQTGYEVDAIVAEPLTQKALDSAQNGAKKRLDDMIGKARARTPSQEVASGPPDMDGEAEFVNDPANETV